MIIAKVLLTKTIESLGSVGEVVDVADGIEEEIGEHIEVSRLQMEHSIETLGPHAVTIGLYKEIAVEVRVRVDGEASPKETRLKETSLDETDLKETPLPEEHLKETSLKEE
jgi:large subunit ribosomal protein L9